MEGCTKVADGSPFFVAMIFHMNQLAMMLSVQFFGHPKKQK